MSPQTIFGLQFLFSLTAIGLLAKWLWVPWLVRRSQGEALFWLTLPHVFRCIAIVFLLPGVLAQSQPNYLAYPVVYGSLLTGVLALLALILLQFERKGVMAAFWLFNVVGTIDLLNALRHVEANFGAAWYIPTIVAPLLLVTHLMIFDRLPRLVAIPEKPISK
jgi:hypothetical protein